MFLKRFLNKEKWEETLVKLKLRFDKRVTTLFFHDFFVPFWHAILIKQLNVGIEFSEFSMEQIHQIVNDSLSPPSYFSLREISIMIF